MIRRNGISDTATIGSVTIGAGENHLGQIGGTTTKVNGSFTRPANTTAYAANQIVSNGSLLTLNAARITGGTGYITALRIVTNNSATTGVQFRVHIAATTQLPTPTDGAAFGLTYTMSSNNGYLGYIDLPATTTQGGSSISYSQDISQRFPFYTEGGTALYFLVETLTIFTPASGQNFSIQIGIEQN